MLNVWLVTIGEPIPVQEALRDRLHRTGALAHFLAQRGHQVVWWSSTFDHFRKKHWFEDDVVLRPHPNLQIRLLHACGYRSNISIARMRDHRQIAAKFAAAVEADGEPPDIIVAALPTIELALESVRYGRRRGIPVVLDMRDMWPDIFVDTAPRAVRPLAKRLLTPLFRQAHEACSGATAIIGHTDGFVEWGLWRGRRAAGPWDRTFHFAYRAEPPSADLLAEADAFWQRQGIDCGQGPLACFIGTLGRQFDLETVLAAARRLAAEGHAWRFVLCGRGDRLEQYRAMARDVPNVLVPGWIDAAQIHVLLRRATIGLDPLIDRYDFLATINNKAIEYLSAGLPVVSSPTRGVLADLLRREGCGASYETGDAEGLAQILTDLSAAPGRLEEMSRGARRVFDERFAADKVYADMEQYLSALASPRTDPSALSEKRP